MNYEDLVSRLFETTRFGIKPGLARMQRALREEGLDEPSFDVITVAGTNGKGSVASRLAAYLQHRGHRVGLYTSPHLVGLRERFRVDGMPLAEDQVQEALERVIETYRREDEDDEKGLTFFELTTLCAMVLFERQEVDVAVMEVGLGGRLDAVNAVEPQTSVITAIDRDHEAYLGEDIASIAGEKAGVLRTQVPAVIAPQSHEEARQRLMEKVRHLGASPAVIADVAEASASLEEMHQWTARMAAQLWMGEEVEDESWESSQVHWRWPGRRDRWRLGERTIWVDAAHNPAGIQSLREWIACGDAEIEGVIWGGMADKDEEGIEAFLEALGVPVWAVELEAQRGRDAQELKAVVPETLWRGASQCDRALERATGQVEGELLAFGSVYLLGELWRAIGGSVDELRTYQE